MLYITNVPAVMLTSLHHITKASIWYRESLTSAQRSIVNVLEEPHGILLLPPPPFFCVPPPPHVLTKRVACCLLLSLLLC